MKAVTMQDVTRLLGTDHVPGDRRQVRVLTGWVQELVDKHGEVYVQEKSEDLLRAWQCFLDECWR